MSEDKDLNKFLTKIDEIGSLIKDMNADDEDKNTGALHRADKYLEKFKSKDATGFNKSVINKYTDKVSAEHQQVNDQQTMSPEDFMKHVEEDSKQRAERKTENLEKAQRLKEKGNKYFKEDDFTNAVTCYSEAIRFAPDQILFYSNRAQTFIKLKKYEEAVNDCVTGQKLDKKFVKIYIHHGRALTYLQKFEEAMNVFKEVAKIDKTQNKLIDGYLQDVEKQRSLALTEKQVNTLLLDGDSAISSIKQFIDSLRKGLENDLLKVSNMLQLMNDITTNVNHRLFFRTSNGFLLFCENPTIRRLLKQDNFSSEDIKHLNGIVSLLSNVCFDCEENSIVACENCDLIGAAVACVKANDNVSANFHSVELFYRLSQYTKCRQLLVNNKNIGNVIDQLLVVLSQGGDVALVAMGMINNMTLEKSFVAKFEEKLSKDFIPGVFKMMELLTFPIHTASVSTSFLPVMASSISTVANLFAKKQMRKMYSADEKIWTVSCKLLSKYIDEVNDTCKGDVLHVTLGMLMNLSTEKVVLDKGVAADWMELFSKCFSSKLTRIEERCCGLLNHLLHHNEEMLRIVLTRKLYLHFIELLKGYNDVIKKYVIKCLALTSSISSDCQQALYERKGLSCLLDLLQSKENAIIGNAALCLSHCAKNKHIAGELVDSSLVKILLTHATNDGLPAQVRHNCALAVGKFSMVDSRYLQQVRDLHGLEILHEVMKINQLV